MTRTVYQYTIAVRVEDDDQDTADAVLDAVERLSVLFELERTIEAALDGQGVDVGAITVEAEGETVFAS